MTRITTTPLAVSEDYRDALVAARRAKNWLFLLLLLFLLAQITIFFLVKYTTVINIGARGEAEVNLPKVDVDVREGGVSVDVTTQPTTEPSQPIEVTGSDADAGSPPVSAADSVGKKELTNDVLAWLVNSIVYLGTIFSILMAVVILLIVLIMLVGRFPGGGMLPSTSSFVWMALLALLLFPWQLCYGPETSASARGADSAYAASPDDDFRVPGALYTWGELRRDAKFSNSPLPFAVQKWARFAGFPVIALLILFAVQAKSGRAVKIALGEADVHVDVASTDV